MEILDLTLVNFRNFSAKKITFDKNLPAGRQVLTVIIGPNGAGKSNILEAVALICGNRPQRVDTDLDLVNFGKSEAKVEGKIALNGDRKILTINFLVVDELHIKKSYLIDDLKKRFADFMSLLGIVIFHPEDLDLVIGSPSDRRHHLDSILSSSSRDYWRNISAYNKIVVRRNRVLARIAEGKAKPMELSFWDSRLLEHGKFISAKRGEFFEFLNFVEKGDSLRALGELSFELKESLISAEKLVNNRERDIAAGMTLSGQHRDDFRFIFKKRDLAFFGSRGEQRMAVLALKLAELEYLKIQRGQRPILALDDIFSELDWQHRDAVLSIIGNQQTIITAAEKDSVPKNLLKKAKVVEL